MVFGNIVVGAHKAIPPIHVIRQQDIVLLPSSTNKPEPRERETK